MDEPHGIAAFLALYRSLEERIGSIDNKLTDVQRTLGGFEHLHQVINDHGERLRVIESELDKSRGVVQSIGVGAHFVSGVLSAIIASIVTGALIAYFHLTAGH